MSRLPAACPRAQVSAPVPHLPHVAAGVWLLSRALCFCGIGETGGKRTRRVVCASAISLKKEGPRGTTIVVRAAYVDGKPLKKRPTRGYAIAQARDSISFKQGIAYPGRQL